MRILLASDLHYQLRQYDWLITAAPQFDAVVIAGDHLDASLDVPGEVQMVALRASFAAIAQHSRLLVCSGNHDLNARNLAGEKTADWLAAARGKATAVDGDTVEIGDTLFTVCPWWDGPQGRAEVEQLLERASTRRRGRWVWVYHAPPLGPLSWTGKRHFGDPLLPALVERFAPSSVFCGHIHEAPFKRDGGWAQRFGTTWLFNPGRQIGPVPAHVVIDFARGRAQWFSLAGDEERTLAD